MSEAVAELIAANRQRSIDAAWDKVLGTPEGRLAVWSILEDCGVFQITTTGSPTDQWRAGFRDAGLSLLNNRVFPHDVRTFADMQVEHAELMQRIQLQAELETGDQDHE